MRSDDFRLGVRFARQTRVPTTIGPPPAADTSLQRSELANSARNGLVQRSKRPHSTGRDQNAARACASWMAGGIEFRGISWAAMRLSISAITFRESGPMCR